MKQPKNILQRIKATSPLPRSPSPSSPQPTRSHTNFTNNLEIRRLLDGHILRQSNVSKDAKQFALDIFNDKLQYIHERRLNKQKAQMNQLIDFYERKMNDGAKLKMERDRLFMYRSMLDAQMKRIQIRLNLTGVRNQKDLQKLVQEIDELMAKIEKLLTQKETNEKNIEQIKNFYLMITKSLSDNITDFREQINKLDHSGGHFKGQPIIPMMSQDSHDNRNARVKSQQLARQKNPSIFRETLQGRSLSNRTLGQQRRRMITAPTKLSQRAFVETMPLSYTFEGDGFDDSQVIQLENDNSLDDLGSFDDRQAQFEHILNDNTITEAEFEKKAIPVTHLVNAANEANDDNKSITSSLGPSVYKEIMDELEPFKTNNPLDNYNSNQQGFIYDPKGTTKFIPVKISFKIGADHLPPYMSTVDFGERIYNDLAIKSLFFHLKETHEICGLQFRFVHRTNQGEFWGKLHGNLGSHYKAIDFNDGEFLNMAHFKHNSQGLFWIKLFTNRNVVDIGSDQQERLTLGIRYFPREVKLCKVFSYFNARTMTLAQMKFIYVRTVFY